MRNQRARFDFGDQLVANWVEFLGPAAGEQYAETQWPETVVLDSTWFTVTNRRTRVTTQAFAVLAAHGYPEWEKFLRPYPANRRW